MKAPVKKKIPFIKQVNKSDTMSRLIPKETSSSFVLFFLFSILTLSIIPIYRIQYFDGWPPGELVYSHMRMGQYIFTYGFPEQNPSLLLDVPFHFDPFDLLLGLAGTLFSFKIAALLLPPLLGLFTLFFFYRIIGLFFPHPKQHLLAGLFCLTNPVFLTLFTEATNLTFITFCLAAGSYFFLQKDRSQYAAPFFFGMILFYGSAHIILTALLIFTLGKMSSKPMYGNCLSFIFVVCLVAQFFLSSLKLEMTFPAFLTLLQQLLSDLGGKFGISVFALFISIFGAYTFWTERKVRAFPHAFFFILSTLFFTFFSASYYLLYLILPITVFATTGFFSLIRRQWKMENLRDLTIFLLILGIIFSATSTVSRTAAIEPDPEMMSALLWLKENSYENAIILTSEKYANTVTYATERRVIYDKIAAADPENELIVEEVQRLFHTRDIDVALSFFEHYQIDYVIVFSDMSSGLIWNTNEEGLLFVLKNGKNFKKVFENNNVAIWSVQY